MICCAYSVDTELGIHTCIVDNGVVQGRANVAADSRPHGCHSGK